MNPNTQTPTYPSTLIIGAGPAGLAMAGPTKTVTFTDSRELSFDAIILATGYRPGLAPVLGADLSARILSERGYPKRLWFDESDLRGLYFLGFTTPLTGIIYNLTIDSEKIAEHVAKNNSVPT